MKRFNIRVYGVFVDAGRLLVTDEIRLGMKMTKLPGGGLEFGEGLANCLRREWREELEAEIEVGDVLYINPFLQPSAFNPAEEVMAIYFRVHAAAPLKGDFSSRRFDFPNEENDQQVFRWIPIDELTASDFTFPIDQSLVPVLRRQWGLDSLSPQ